MKKNVVLKDSRGAARVSGTIEYGGEKDFITLSFMQFVGEMRKGKIYELKPECSEILQSKKKYFFLSAYTEIDGIVCVCDGELLYFSPDGKTDYTEVKSGYENFIEKKGDAAPDDQTYEYDDYAIAEDDYYKYRKGAEFFMRDGEKINAKTSQNDDAEESRQGQKIKTKGETFSHEYAENEESCAQQKRCNELKRLALKIAFSGGKSQLSRVIPNSLWLKEGDGLVGIIGDKYAPSYLAFASATTRADFYGSQNNLYPKGDGTLPSNTIRAKTFTPPLSDKKFFVPECVLSSSSFGYALTFENLKRF